ncbi:MAG: hypothetical protein BMS9Abin20_0875 [Acidimicrobiia bacterium]|nr:MAG: hypothetical protein BMS9Abin20_0875 [Acidimicrobiia bacterium]
MGGLTGSSVGNGMIVPKSTPDASSGYSLHLGYPDGTDVVSPCLMRQATVLLPPLVGAFRTADVQRRNIRCARMS